MKKMLLLGLALVLMAGFFTAGSAVAAGNNVVENTIVISGDIPPTGIGQLKIVGTKKVGSVLYLQNDFIRRHPEMFRIVWWHGCGDNAAEYVNARNKMRVKLKYRDHVEVIATVRSGYLKDAAFHSLAVTVKGTKNCMNF